MAWFALASLACGLAPNVEVLIAARALQGVGGALLTPGSLALISASFHGPDRAAAVGAWSGLGGVAGAVGPFLGGWLVEWTWRAVFLINIPLAALVIVVALRHVPESRDPESAPGLDVSGAVLGALGLGLLTWGLTALGADGVDRGRAGHHGRGRGRAGRVRAGRDGARRTRSCRPRCSPTRCSARPTSPRCSSTGR